MVNEKNPSNKEHGTERMTEQALEGTQGVIRQLQSVEAQKGDQVERGKQLMQASLCREFIRGWIKIANYLIQKLSWAALVEETSHVSFYVWNLEG